jgi:hypothetical protein
MSEGMYVELDSFTAADREMLKDLQVREAPRSEEVMAEVTIIAWLRRC